MEAAADSALLAFGVTAKVADQTAHGDGGLDLRRGLRHFAADARVWVLPRQWGDGGDAFIRDTLAQVPDDADDRSNWKADSPLLFRSPGGRAGGRRSL